MPTVNNDDDDIVVTGERDGIPYNGEFSGSWRDQYGTGGTAGSGGGGGTGSGSEPTLDQRAQAYADEHVQPGPGFDPSNPDHQKAMAEIKQAVIAAYKAAHDGIAGNIKMSNGQTLTDAQLASVLEDAFFSIQTADLPDNVGGDFRPLAGDNGESINRIRIDIDSPNFDLLSDPNGGHFGSYDEAINFTVLHEIGHAIDFRIIGNNNNPGQTISSTVAEAYANTYAMALDDAFGLAGPTAAEMQSAGYQYYTF